MKDMSMIMREAHRLTKEIKREFPGVNYNFQLGICMSYLLKEKGENEMVELQGTEKQVKWANDIREELLKIVNEVEHNRLYKAIVEEEKATYFIESFKMMTSKYSTQLDKERMVNRIEGEMEFDAFVKGEETEKDLMTKE